MRKIYKVNDLPANTLIAKDMVSIDYYDSYMTVRKTDDSIERIVEKNPYPTSLD